MVGGPSWFLGFDALFDVIFFLVTLTVTILGFRAYKFFRKDQYKMHGIGFLLLCLSYLSLGLTNLFIFLEEREHDTLSMTLREFTQIIRTGVFVYALLFLAGLVFLLFVYLQINDIRVRLLVMVLVLFSIAVGGHVSAMFNVLLAIMLLFIIAKLYEGYRLKPKRAGLLVLFGFICIFAGEMLLSAIFIAPLVYVFSHVAILAGFVSILVSQHVVS